LIKRKISNLLTGTASRKTAFGFTLLKVFLQPNQINYMRKVLLFGSTGNLGKKVGEELKQRGFNVTAVVRNEARLKDVSPFAHHILIADVAQKGTMKGICNGYDIVVSTLGKSVSPNEKSRLSFQEIDLEANSHILAEAVKSGVQKFVYISAFHAERLTHLEYFRVHHEFSERLKHSGIDYLIVKPPAIFSAFVDLIDMARKGQLVTMGKGDKHTNPIYEGDLAKVIVDAIDQSNAVIEVGGKEVMTRKQINKTIQQVVAPNKKVRTVPIGVIKLFLPFIKVVSKNLYDKVAFFTAVMQEDVVAPRVGNMRLEEYITMKVSPTFKSKIL
jgi:uncharacterized protein YbjT (DUF2867 family)